MNKILSDLEDFVLPEKQIIENRTEKDYDNLINLVKELLNYSNNIDLNKINIEKARLKFSHYFNKLNRESKLNTKKTELIIIYQKLIESNNIQKNNLFEQLIVKKPSRSISGINSITVVMSPYPNGQSFSCKHDCFYCPDEPAHKGNLNQAQPRSYLYHEPAVRRANRNGFRAYDQMIDRLDTLKVNGHNCDKLEIIIEGGTYTEYPVKYLEDYNRDIYYAANTYYEYPKRDKLTLQEEIKINKNAKVHIIGNCIETRPDSLSDDWILHFRQCGITRIQLGVQSTHNHILKKINRGHNIECAYEAIELLKNFGFKIDIHIMPDLPYTTPLLDKMMMDYTYQILQPDQIKIYPCQVVPWTRIEKWYNEGKWNPYEPEVLKEVMDYAMKTCPDWIRLPRVIRDIPGVYIQAGNKKTNLRQMLVESQEIRSREIERHTEYYNKKARIFIECYNNCKESGTKDYFISYESMDKKALFGFIRLRLPGKNQIIFTEKSIKNIKKPYELFKCLKDCALIRELHVYGYNTAVGYEGIASQHKGIGSLLLKKAEKIAQYNNFKGIVVISGEGVKEYYEKKNFIEFETYMKKIFKKSDYLNSIILIGFIILSVSVLLNYINE